MCACLCACVECGGWRELWGFSGNTVKKKILSTPQLVVLSWALREPV